MGGADLDLVAFALPQDAGHGLMEGASEHLAPGRKNLRNLTLTLHCGSSQNNFSCCIVF